MSEPRTVPLENMPWSEDAPGIRAREAELDGARWAIVEYEAGARREEWCEDGHRGYVISGRIEYEFDDERRSLTASEGEAFFLPKTRYGQGAHRGRNLSSTPTRLFLIDDSPDKQPPE